jgi:hypothetical protein
VYQMPGLPCPTETTHDGRGMLQSSPALPPHC